MLKNSYLYLSLSNTLGLKVKTNLGGTNILDFVTGLTEIRSDFFLTSKDPNPCAETTLPSDNCCVISDSKEAINSDVSFNVYPSLRDNSEVNSLLFKIFEVL